MIKANVNPQKCFSINFLFFILPTRFCLLKCNYQKLEVKKIGLPLLNQSEWLMYPFNTWMEMDGKAGGLSALTLNAEERDKVGFGRKRSCIKSKLRDGGRWKDLGMAMAILSILEFDGSTHYLEQSIL